MAKETDSGIELNEHPPDPPMTSTSPASEFNARMAGGKMDSLHSMSLNQTNVSSQDDSAIDSAEDVGPHGRDCRTCPRKMSLWRDPHTQLWRIVGQSEKTELDTYTMQSQLTGFLQCRTKTVLLMIQDMDSDWTSALKVLSKYANTSQTNIAVQFGSHYPAVTQKIERDHKTIKFAAKLHWKKMFIFWLSFKDHKDLVDLVSKTTFVKLFGVSATDSPHMADFSSCNHVTKQLSRIPPNGPIPFLPRQLSQLDLYIDLPPEQHELTDWFSLVAKCLRRLRAMAIYLDIPADQKLSVTHIERVLSIFSQSLARMIGLCLTRQQAKKLHMDVKLEVEDWQQRSYRSIIFGIPSMVMRHTQAIHIRQNEFVTEKGGLWKVDKLEAHMTNQENDISNFQDYISSWSEKY